MPVLTVLCGIPGSGKSTFSRGLAETGIKCVASDEYRRFITGHYGDSRHDGFIKRICREVVEHYLVFGSDVCYDATNPTPESRRTWVDLGNALGTPVKCIWIDAPLDTCIRRNENRENVVPVEVITRIRDAFIPPDQSEGFHEILRLNG